MIGKNKVNLQLSISNKALETLNKLINQYEQKNGIKPTKSQYIELLITSYEKPQEQKTVKNSFIKESKPKETRPRNNGQFQSQAINETESKELLNRLNAYRNESRLSVVVIAEKIGINYDTFRKLLTGHRKITESNGQKIRLFLDNNK